MSRRALAPVETTEVCTTQIKNHHPNTGNPKPQGGPEYNSGRAQRAGNQQCRQEIHNPPPIQINAGFAPIQRSDCLKKSDFNHVCLPFFPFFDHGVENDEQFPHGGHEGDHFGLSIFHEPFVERFDPGVVIQGRDGGHV